MTGRKLPSIPHAYRAKMKKIFEAYLKEFYQISNLGLFIVLPNKELLYTSTCYQLSEVYVARNYHVYDLMLKSHIYDKFPIYPWRLKQTNMYVEELNTLREKIFNLNSGTSFVRKIVDKNNEEFTIIYAISTYSKDPLMQYIYACKVNEIIAVCDFIYNSFREIFERFTSYLLPEIEEGTSLPSYTNEIIKNFQLTPTNSRDIMDLIKKIDVSCLLSQRIVEDLNLNITRLSKSTS